jgi:hypothetical protein
VKHINRILGLVLGGLVLTIAPAMAESNLCPNGSFTSTNNPFEGWGLDYDWSGNSKQMGNHKNVSFLPEYKGRSNVLKMVVPAGYESKVETPIMEYDPGDRYKCTFDLYTDVVGMRLLFLGYALAPGVPPSELPKFSDLRRIYKGDTVESKGASWKSMTVIFPHEQISELAYKHLKKVRYMTVMMFVPGALFGAGTFYISNVKIVKLPGKCKVMKSASKSSGDE